MFIGAIDNGCTIFFAMSIIEIVLLGLALSADAFAVSLVSGVKMPHFLYKNALVYALFFGVFQALMPLLGYFFGNVLSSFVDKYTSYISFALLLIIGVKMIVDAVRSKDETCDKNCDICEKHNTCKIIKVNYKELLMLAISTSLDAFAVGVSFSLLKVNLALSVSIVGAITFILSFLGVYIGYKFGSKFEKIPEIIGGCVLILIGFKILLF